MITLTSQDELKAAKDALEQLKQDHPTIFNKFVHVINLTRALQFKYQYLGSLLMDEPTNDGSPAFVKPSVIQLYKQEVSQVKEDPDAEKVKQIFTNFRSAGYAKLSLLALGTSPESLSGGSVIR
ncbi:hypothetical protein JOC78_002598 [Bacillus ectoiniformans]|uniref:hypothetical protein n=1 Tax=Bacillus ectoiniformans TaxID=1494429 RepID=UPI0019594D27|nr:hypothetical protein [Bacillus ectoiniformans]MBM7649624.1 hypothetical protein [Bacillus ectoiniformans]